jgi:hypothetical protein
MMQIRYIIVSPMLSNKGDNRYFERAPDIFLNSGVHADMDTISNKALSCKINRGFTVSIGWANPNRRLKNKMLKGKFSDRNNTHPIITTNKR